MIWGPGKLLFIHIAEKASSNMKELKEAILVEGKGIKGDRYYNNIGKADITYLVDFSLLQRFIKKRGLSLSNLVSQSFFLKRLGIINRAENISKKLNFREKADIYYRLDRLLNKNKMGEMFKVIFASSKKIKFNLGFK